MFNDDNNVTMMVSQFIGKITGIVLRYVCLAWAIAWGIHLASTL